MAIGLLAVGTTTSQVKGCGEASCDSLFTAPIQGYLLGILSAGFSALARIYTEFLMKRNNDTLYWQNLQLYNRENETEHVEVFGDRENRKRIKRIITLIIF